MSTPPLPNVLYIGMGKSGSTMIYKVMQRNPAICASPSLKELNFFGKNERWNQGLDFFREAFPNYAGERYIYDNSPANHIKDRTLDRIVETLGTDVKIIFTLRRFTDFAYSRYLQKIRSRRIPHSLLHELDTLGNFYRPLDVILERYVNTFGRENVLIMEYERDFIPGAPKFEPKVLEFLGLDPKATYYDPETDGKVNKGYIPRFCIAGPEGVEEVEGDNRYRVRNKIVFCDGYRRQNEYWRHPSPAMIAEVQALAAKWTTVVTPELHAYIQEKYTLPLARGLQDKLGLDLDYWDTGPREIAYDPAPLPDAHIVGPNGLTGMQMRWN